MPAARGRVTIQQHAGRLSNVSPHMVGEGAQEQDNLTVQIAGQLNARKGNRVITITNAAATASSDIIAIAAIARPEYVGILYQTASGDIRLAKGPA